MSQSPGFGGRAPTLRYQRPMVALIVGAFVLAACGGDTDPAASGGQGSAPLTPLPMVAVPAPASSPGFAALAAFRPITAPSAGSAGAVDQLPSGPSEARGSIDQLRWIGLPPPYPAHYVPSDAEIHPEIKAVAAAVAYDLTNYPEGSSSSEIAAAVAGDAEASQLLAESAAPLWHDGMWSRGTIVYPQLGGLANGRASVMVVVAQTLGVGGFTEHTVTRTLDIRLVEGPDGWRFESLEDAGGAVVERPRDLSAPARRVLDHPRIHLPDSARWDIHRGFVSDQLLSVMADLAEFVEYGVVSLSNGHPEHIFGTDRVSNHTVGRAVDVYLIDGETVVASRDRDSKTFEVASWLFDRPDIYNFGSPWALDGRGGQSFSDRLHQDHFHIAVPRE